MKNYQYIFFSILMTCNLSLLQAQRKSEIENLKTEATAYMDKYKFFPALQTYKQLDSIPNQKGKYDYNIGFCYLSIGKNEQALEYFKKVEKGDNKKYPLSVHYFLGKCYQYDHQFDNAIKEFETYKAKLISRKRNRPSLETISEIDKYIQECKTGIEMIASPVNVKIYNMGPEINSPYPDYGPVVSADEKSIIFTSSRPNTTGGLIDDFDGNYHEDIYISHKENDKWSTPKGISVNINSPGHEAAIASSPDGHLLLFYKHIDGNPESNTSGDLYTSELKGDTWVIPDKLDKKINSGGWEPSGCFSSDEKTFIFASTRKDGFGGTDLFISRKGPDGNWTEPVNLGKEINTPYDEDSPYLHADGKTLYFSSKGHSNMGGFDIFSSKFDDAGKSWSKPQNIGYPINTAHDDIYFSWSADGTTAYFSSYRKENSYGDKDIYYAKIYEETSDIMVLKGIVVDSLTSKPIEASISIKDKKSKEVLGVFQSNSISGKYLVILPYGTDYEVSVESPDYEFCNQNINLSESTSYSELDKTIKLCPLKK